MMYMRLALMTLLILVLTIRHNAGVKVIRNDGGDMGPVRLWAFAALVEVAMIQVLEIESGRRGKRKS